MTKEFELMAAENRYAKLAESPKNFKCPGVLRKLRRKIRNLRKEISN